MVTENDDGFTYVEDISFAETRVYQMLKGLIERISQENLYFILNTRGGIQPAMRIHGNSWFSR